MSTYNQQTDVQPRRLAKSESINNLDNAVAAAFALLPDETDLKHGTVSYAADSGTVNAYVVALSQVPDSYTDGLKVVIKPANTNTGASTINVNSLGVKSIRHYDSSVLTAGDLQAGAPTVLRYSSTTGFFHVQPNSIAAAETATTKAAEAEASASAAALSASSAASSAASISSQVTKIDGIEANADVTDAANVAAAGAVMNTGNETIGGIKTFSSFMVTPTGAPTTDYQAANKKYVDDQVSSSIPTGCILIWSGSIATIPLGFALCDGNNGTPNLTDRFILHADADLGGTNNVGNTGTGGSTTDGHALTTNEMPSHSHTITHSTDTGSAGVLKSLGQGASTNQNTNTINPTGNSQAHSHTITNYKPKYYALAYIMKIT